MFGSTEAAGLPTRFVRSSDFDARVATVAGMGLLVALVWKAAGRFAACQTCRLVDVQQTAVIAEHAIIYRHKYTQLLFTRNRQ